MKRTTVIISFCVYSLLIFSTAAAQDQTIKIRVSAILVKTEAEAKLIIDTLNAGADFSELARDKVNLFTSPLAAGFHLVTEKIHFL